MPVRQSQAIPAVCSFFLPGLGQLVQGRLVPAAGFFFGFMAATVAIVAVVGVVLAPAVWLWGIYDAAVWQPGE